MRICDYLIGLQVDYYAPRACGDDPNYIMVAADGKTCSPRMRG